MNPFDHLDPKLREDLARSALEKFCSAPIKVDGGWSVRCGSRLKSRCPSCANIYSNDWAAIIRSGVFEADVSDYQWVFLTLTAPSWGRTHNVPKADSGSVAACHCGQRHTAASAALRGVPIDMGSYDYASAVRWNRDLGKLWDATRSKLRLHLPNFEYAIIREWQLRGSLHTHAVLRVPKEESMDPAALGQLARSTVSWGSDGSEVRWGSQVDSREIAPGISTAQHVWYLSKALYYSLKSTTIELDHESKQHLIHLSTAASRMSCVRCGGNGYCAAKCHSNFGSKSSVVSVSRKTENRPGWSLTGLTRGVQKEVRRKWAVANSDPLASPGIPQDNIDLARWAARTLVA